jgi:cytoskeletal protein CcmA (bactofilin family)
VIYKAGNNSQNNHKRRLEDQFGTQYSVINEDVEIEGTLNAHDNFRMGGYLKGQIQSSAVVWISKNGKVDGNINSNGLIVEGYVHGNVRCTGKVELRPGALIKGDIACASLAVYKGCALEGKVKMLEGELHTFVAKRNMFENEPNI